MTNVTSAKDQIFELCNAKELKKKKKSCDLQGPLQAQLWGIISRCVAMEHSPKALPRLLKVIFFLISPKKLLHWWSRFLQCSSTPASGTTPTTNHNNNMSYVSVFVRVRVCTLDDTAKASWPPEISSVLPGSEQDDVSEPGSVFRPGAAQPASGGVLPHQQSLHRLWGAGQRAALQKTHRSPALPASALAKWVIILCLFFCEQTFFLDNILTC